MSDDKLIVSKPAYLANIPKEDMDNSDLRAYSKPPRLKIIQAMTGPPLKPPYKQGDVILLPQMVKVADYESQFPFVVVAFFPSWICMNPVQTRGTLKSIREFSIDPQSELAIKCKKFIVEKCPEAREYNLDYRSTLNFLCILPDVKELNFMPVHMFFSKGSYKTGEALIALMEGRGVPRYCCRFRAGVIDIPGKQNMLFPAFVIDDDPQPWVTEEDLPIYQKAYHELKELITKQQIELDTNAIGDPEDLPTTGEF